MKKYNLKDMIKPKISNLLFMSFGSILTLLVLSLFGFTTRNSQENMSFEQNDTLKIDVPSLRYLELIVGDSASELTISIYDAQILNVLNKDKASKQGVEYNYSDDGCLYSKTAFIWFLENDTSRYWNDVFEGDKDFMGKRVRNYVYHGDCFVYERKPKPRYEAKFENGLFIQ